MELLAVFKKTYYFRKHSLDFFFNCSDRKDLKQETFHQLRVQQVNWTHACSTYIIALADVRLFDQTVPANQKMLVFLQVWKAPIISPGLRSQPPITCQKIMNGLYSMSFICASCSQKAWRRLIGCWELWPLSLSHIPQTKNIQPRPTCLNDVKQTLFTHICIPKISPPRNFCKVNIEFYFCFFPSSLTKVINNCLALRNYIHLTLI